MVRAARTSAASRASVGWCNSGKVSAMASQCAVVLLSLCLLADFQQVAAFTLTRPNDSPSSAGLLTDAAGDNLLFMPLSRQNTIALLKSYLSQNEASEIKEEEEQHSQQRRAEKVYQGQGQGEVQGHFQLPSLTQQALPSLIKRTAAAKMKKTAAASTQSFCIWKICPPYSYRKTKRAAQVQRKR